MTDEEWGALLVRQQKLEVQVAGIRTALKASAVVMGRIAQELSSSPERLVFSNAPSPLGTYPSELMGAPSHEWGQLKAALAPEVFAQQIQDLRAAIRELNEVKRALSNR